MKNIQFSLILGFLFIFLNLQAQDCTVTPTVSEVCTFTSDGDFIVPVGFTVNVSVRAWGGGGGGGNSDSGSQHGGGGGGYSAASFVNVTAGNYSITVGSGGAEGSNGGNSTFNFGSVVTASGGSTTGTGGAGTTANGGEGGNSGGSFGGGGGGSGPAATNGGDGGAGSGGAAGTPGGGAGGSNMNPGVSGTAVGGGGGGKGNNGGTSGAGANGEVIVTITSFIDLPVELLSFTAKPVVNTILLNWETATELNNEKFVIEHSTDGRTFFAIGEQRGVGTTHEQQSYTFSDNKPVRGVNYYRLKQMDFDGQFEYSPVEKVVFSGKGKVALFPTSTRGLLNITTDEDRPSTVMVYALNGARLLEKSFDSSHNMEMNLSQLANGIYIVAIQMNGETYQERVVKF